MPAYLTKEGRIEHFSKPEYGRDTGRNLEHKLQDMNDRRTVWEMIWGELVTQQQRATAAHVFRQREVHELRLGATSASRIPQAKVQEEDSIAVSFEGDSQLVINWLGGEWRSNMRHYRLRAAATQQTCE